MRILLYFLYIKFNLSKKIEYFCGNNNNINCSQPCVNDCLNNNICIGTMGICNNNITLPTQTTIPTQTTTPQFITYEPNINFCGTRYETINCSHPCPSGQPSECLSNYPGEICYKAKEVCYSQSSTTSLNFNNIFILLMLSTIILIL